MSTYPYEFDIAAARGWNARQSGGASRGGFDESKLPPRVTAICGGKEIVPEPAKPTRTTSASQTIRNGTVLRRKAEPVKPVTAESAPVAIAPTATVDTAELNAARVQLLSVLKARKAELEREEAEAAEARKAAEAEAQLRKERAELVALMRDADMEVFAAIWPDHGCTREYLVSWVTRIEDCSQLCNLRMRIDQQIAKQTKAKAEAELAQQRAEEARREAEAAELRKEQERQAREDAALRDERSQLIEAFRVVDMEVFALLWPGKSFTREYIISWVRGLDIAIVRSTQRHLADKTAQHVTAKAKAEAERREAEVRAEKVNPKKKGFNVLAYLLASAGKSVVPAAPPKSKAELAEIDRRINGGSIETWRIIEYVSSKECSLRERILALDPATVARLHTDRPEAYRRVWRKDRYVTELIVHTWPSIDRLLAALGAAKMKTGGRVHDDSDAIARIGIFVTWCEQG